MAHDCPTSGPAPPHPPTRPRRAIPSPPARRSAPSSPRPAAPRRRLSSCRRKPESSPASACTVRGRKAPRRGRRVFWKKLLRAQTLTRANLARSAPAPWPRPESVVRRAPISVLATPRGGRRVFWKKLLRAQMAPFRTSGHPSRAPGVLTAQPRPHGPAPGRCPRPRPASGARLRRRRGRWAWGRSGGAGRRRRLTCQAAVHGDRCGWRSGDAGRAGAFRSAMRCGGTGRVTKSPWRGRCGRRGLWIGMWRGCLGTWRTGTGERGRRWWSSRDRSWRRRLRRGCRAERPVR